MTIAIVAMVMIIKVITIIINNSGTERHNSSHCFSRHSSTHSTADWQFHSQHCRLTIPLTALQTDSSTHSTADWQFHSTHSTADWQFHSQLTVPLTALQTDSSTHSTADWQFHSQHCRLTIPFTALQTGYSTHRLKGQHITSHNNPKCYVLERFTR